MNRDQEVALGNMRNMRNVIDLKRKDLERSKELYQWTKRDAERVGLDLATIDGGIHAHD